MFLANYGDVLTDAPLPELVADLHAQQMVATLPLRASRGYTFHIVRTGETGLVSALQDTTVRTSGSTAATSSSARRSSTSSHEGEDLVEEPFERLIAAGKLFAHKYEGFWAPMDTLKDQQKLEAMLENGNGPWRVWEDGAEPAAPSAPAEARDADALRPHVLLARPRCSAPTATTSRSAAAARCCGCWRRTPGSVSTGSSSAPTLAGQPRLAPARQRFSAAPTANVAVEQFRGRFFPYNGVEIKEYFDGLGASTSPDVVFTHNGQDLHQDHRLLSALTYNTFRDHLILEYEIPKYDGDLGRPNVFVGLDRAHVQRKAETIFDVFESQRDKHWFSQETFVSMARLRGIEARAPGGYAEAFYCRKLVLA